MASMTPDRRKTLLRFLRGGLPIDTSARLAGVDPEDVAAWQRQSTRREAGFIRLNAEIAEAMAEGEAIQVARISEAGKTSWRAAAWLLERVHPDRWGPTLPIEVPDAPPATTDDLTGL